MDIVEILDAVDSFVWGIPMLVLLLGSHIFLTFRTGFIQRKIPQAIKMTFKKDPDAEGDISQFGALTTALSATIGTGNIVGVGTAIALGGPGAVLWMWLTGVFGIATKYAETYIGVKYRVKDHKGNMLGGAMYAWRRAFEKNGKAPWWALLGAGAFALFAAIASFGIGSAVQSSAMTEVVTTNFSGVPTWAVGLVIVVAVGLVIIGGIKSISKVCEKLVPFMAIAYALGCIVIIVLNWEFVGAAIALICTSAFTGEAAFGGAVGSGLMVAMQFGCARGLFSNESGMGSAPIAAAAAQTKNPAKQSLISMTGTFWDTVIICALTGIVIVSTMLATPDILNNPSVYSNYTDPSVATVEQAEANAEIESTLAGVDFSAGALTEDGQEVVGNIKGGSLTSIAFAKIPYIGTPVLVLGMILFAFSTILGWSYYGNRCITYLFGKRAIKPYQVLYVAVAFLGAIGIGGLVWTVSDITNALMAVPNIIVVLLLSGLIARETKHFVWDKNLDESDDTEIPVIDSK